MLGIAMYFRSHNMTIDNIKKMLMKWYKDQDQSLISSTEKEVLDDIDKICDWVVARDRKDRLFANITKNELAYLMSIGSKAQRRIAFFLYSCVVAKSKFTIAYEKLGEYIGASHVTVIGGVDLLVDRGIIHRKKQKRKIGESGYYNTYPNIYSLERSAHAEIQDQYVKNEAVQVSVYSLIHNFFETYYAALNYMFTDSYLKKVLSKAEFVEYRKTVDHVNNPTAKAGGLQKL